MSKTTMLFMSHMLVSLKCQSTKYKVHENRNTVHFKRESYVQNKFATYVAHASLLKMSKYKVQSTREP